MNALQAKTALGCAAVVFFSIALTPPASAQTKKGDSILSLGLGSGVPVSELDLSGIRAGDQSPGDPGFLVDGRYLYHVSDFVGLGAEIGHASFADRTFVVPGLAGTIDAGLWTAQGVIRYLFLPADTVSPYVIGGLGLGQFSARVRRTSNLSAVRLDADSTGAAFSLGGGVEASLARSALVGIELRWLLATIDSDKFGEDAFNALGVAARLGFKF